MAKFLVGNSANTWSFENALQRAVSGDVIEFEKGCSLTVGRVNVEKDLQFIGYVEQDGNGGQTFMNTINGQFFIGNGVSASFQNLWIEYNKEKSNVINCSDSSKVQMQNIVVGNRIEQGEVYPVIYGENGAELLMDKVEVIPNSSKDIQMYVLGGKVELNNSNFFNAKIVGEKSSVNVYNSVITPAISNAIQASNSTVVLENVTCNGVSEEFDRPAIWSSKSTINIKKCTVRQPHYDASVYLIDNSFLDVDYCIFTSIKLLDGRANIRNTTINESIQILNNAYAYIDGELNILGENDERVHVYADNKSVLRGDKIIFNKIINPNIRVCGTSLFDLKNIVLVGGDAEDIQTEVDDTSSLAKGSMETQGVVSVTQEKESGNAREQLEKMVGLKSVKKEIERMLRMVEFNQQRIAKGLEPQEQSYHAVFLGNPGTGKTTVARLIGEVLFESGAFKSDEFKLVEASEPDFISQNVGGTAQQTLALLEKAKGGVLFIDEAYALDKKGANVDFGIEAINTILKYMEDHRDEIMIIFAGYTKEMEQFLKTNPGLKSRIPNKFVFEDYTPEEIVEIGVKELSDKQYTLEDPEFYEQQVKRAYRNSLDHSNARWIRNFNEKLVKSFADRVMDSGEDDFETIRKIDIEDVMSQSKYKNLGATQEDARERLEKLIGISKVKEQVDQFIALAELNQKREEQGLETGDFTLHSLFLGNPGTGKTTVARLVGEILYQKGVIAEKKFVEVSQSDLIAGFVGQTATKTKEVLESALGGVLFIDEAYAITQGESNNFGSEAVNEILKFMEDHRRDVVIILAGYTNEMQEFMSTNSGLVSRVPHTFDFEDYTQDELVQIGLLSMHSNGYELDEEHYADIVKKCYQTSNDHSNGRWVRNLNEKIIMVMSKRISETQDTDLSTVRNEDMDVLLLEESTSDFSDSKELLVDENGYVLPS